MSCHGTLRVLLVSQGKIVALGRSAALLNLLTSCFLYSIYIDNYSKHGIFGSAIYFPEYEYTVSVPVRKWRNPGTQSRFFFRLGSFRLNSARFG